MDRPHLLSTAAVATGLLVLAACGTGPSDGTAHPAPAASTATPTSTSTSTSTATSTSTSTSTAARVVFVRSGGFAGVEQRLDVDPQGRWTYTEYGKNATHGHLTPEQSHRLQRLGERLALDVAMEKELKRETCADAFQYSFTIGRRTLTWGQCRGHPSQTLLATTRLLVEHTPM